MVAVGRRAGGRLPGLRNPLGMTPAAVPFGAVAAGLAGLLGCAVLAAMMKSQPQAWAALASSADPTCQAASAPAAVTTST